MYIYRCIYVAANVQNHINSIHGGKEEGNGHIDDLIGPRRPPNMNRMRCSTMMSMINELKKAFNLIKKTSCSLLNETNPPAMKEEVLKVKN